MTKLEKTLTGVVVIFVLAASAFVYRDGIARAKYDAFKEAQQPMIEKAGKEAKAALDSIPVLQKTVADQNAKLEKLKNLPATVRQIAEQANETNMFGGMHVEPDSNVPNSPGSLVLDDPMAFQRGRISCEQCENEKESLKKQALSWDEAVKKQKEEFAAEHDLRLKAENALKGGTKGRRIKEFVKCGALAGAGALIGSKVGKETGAAIGAGAGVAACKIGF
jgi:hypothetical protein